MAAFLESLFISVLNMSITAAAIIIAILLVRLPLKKAPKAIAYGLWFVVLFRLLCPVSFTSAISLFGLFGSGSSVMEPIPANIGTMMQPQVDIVIPAATKAFNTVLPAATPAASVNPVQSIMFILALVWALGVISLLIYSVVSYLLLKHRISTATLIRDNIYQTDRICSPFVCGFIKPKIYLPLTLEDREQEYIIRHEQIHIRKRDYLLKPLWFFAVCLHWFNPLVWVAFFLMSKDMEMSCDEAVIREMGENIKKDYSASLLALSVSRQSLAGSPLAFGETGTLARVKNVMKYKRPGFWVIVVAVAVVVAVSAVLAANPQAVETKPGLTRQFLQYKTEYVGNNAKVGGIIALLAFPEGIHYDSFALQTEFEPYEITVKLKSDASSREKSRTNPLNRRQFETNAAIMFSLIGNVEVINFSLPDDVGGNTFVYIRDWADKRYGRDIREFAGSEEEFDKLLSGHAATTEPAQGEPAYALMKLGRNGEVLAARLSLTGEETRLIEKTVFNALIKSTIWKGVDTGSLDECYLIRATYPDKSSTDYYAFMLDGLACLQTGQYGYYSRIDNELYAALVESI
ncbi:MAG: M56 family metallopeptidase [Heliobacteriaceae bacterium]|nr:M56 family metallopeptidase [Heliobacteriaceae bacterium]